MADKILLKRDATPGLAPTTSQLALGELGVNTFDGKLYFKKNDGTEQIVEVGNPVPTDAISTDSIQNLAVTEAKIADGAISSTKIANNAVGTAQMANASVGETQLASNAVTSIKIASGAVTGTKIADNAIDSAKIVDGTIATDDLANLAVTGAKIAANTITSAKVDSTVCVATSDTGSMNMPAGTTTQRETATYGAGSVRYNTTNNALEFYTGADWFSLQGYNGVTLDSNGIQWSGTYTGDPSITGNTEMNGDLTTTGSVTLGAATGNTITVNGATTFAATGTAVSVTNNALVGGTLTVNGSTTLGDNTTDTVSVGGTLTAQGDLIAYSDARLKNNWQDLESDVLTKALDIQYGTYQRIDSLERKVGVTAQSLQEVIPEAVHEDENGVLGVAYGNAALTLVLELNKKVAELEAEIQRLKDK